MTAADTTGLTVVSGPHAPLPTVRHCDVGGEALPRDAGWWLVTAPDREWHAAHGACCGQHLPVPKIAPTTHAHPRRSGYSDALAASEETRRSTAIG